MHTYAHARNLLQVLSAGVGLAPGGSVDGGLVISFVVEGSSGEGAGIRAGDELVAVNGTPVKRGTQPRLVEWSEQSVVA
jgi:predicted metalloprotease with PDZ domain